MTLPVFWELVEARTKLASILPFLVGTLFAALYFQQFNGINTAIFFVAMLLFDMTTTAINNLMDYHKAKDQTYRDQTNIVGRAHLNPTGVAALIGVMLLIATALGLILVWRTDWLLLLIGAVCFGIGIFYTFGPLPLSRLPLGEVFSGVTMGLAIPFIAIYVNVDAAKLLNLTITWPRFDLSGDFVALILIGLTCVPCMATIANVMLANNLSDYDEDVQNGRTTLPMYLGKKWGLVLYQFLAYVGYPVIVLVVALGGLPVVTLLMLISLPWVIKNTNRFVAKQVKAETFVTAVRTLMIENGSLILAMLIGWGLPG